MPERPTHDAVTRQFAQKWMLPTDVTRIEEGRYPTQRALSKIIGGVFRDHVGEGDTVFEVGAGLGFLKELVPKQFHRGLISTDYSQWNLSKGKERRELRAVAASATELPLRDNSVDVVVNMDAYDTLPHLQPALDEAARVLRPGGKFIHLQVNMPDEDVIMHDHPDTLFFPTGRGRLENPYMTGLSIDGLIQGTSYIPYVVLKQTEKFFDQLLADPIAGYHKMRQDIEKDPRYSDYLGDLLDLFSEGKFAIPSPHAYFGDKLNTAATTSGLLVVESRYREASVTDRRNDWQKEYPEANAFIAKNGLHGHRLNYHLATSETVDIVEASNLLVFVAKKPIPNQPDGATHQEAA